MPKSDRENSQSFEYQELKTIEFLVFFLNPGCQTSAHLICLFLKRLPNRIDLESEYKIRKAQEQRAKQ